MLNSPLTVMNYLCIVAWKPTLFSHLLILLSGNVSSIGFLNGPGKSVKFSLPHLFKKKQLKRTHCVFSSCHCLLNTISPSSPPGMGNFSAGGGHHFSSAVLATYCRTTQLPKQMYVQNAILNMDKRYAYV